MSDQSQLDARYFIDSHVYNCPFCNRRNVQYYLSGYLQFDWTSIKEAHAYTVLCSSCKRTSFHLSFTPVRRDYVMNHPTHGRLFCFAEDADFDKLFFYSVPSSFFVVDQRIPKRIRELITEAEGCLKMNFLTGGSACARKAIYELLEITGAEGKDYEARIKSLKSRYPESDPVLFDVLARIQAMTSSKLHEASSPAWDAHALRLILETVMGVLHEIYVVPDERKRRRGEILKLEERVKGRPKDPP